MMPEVAAASEPTGGYAVPMAERRAHLEALLLASPNASVGLLDAARNIGSAREALADAGMTVGSRAQLRAATLGGLLAVADVWMMSQASVEARVRGSAQRDVGLRDGQRADLHLVELCDSESKTIVVIVPHGGGNIDGDPPPSAIAASPRIGVVMCDAFGVVESTSASTLVLLGRPPGPLSGLPIITLIHPDDQIMAIVNWSAAKEQRGVALRWRCRIRRADGSWLWVETTITNEITPEGTGDVRFDLYDISAEVAATDALVAERELIVILTETLPVGVAMFDAEGRVEHANRRLTDLLAPLDPAELLGQAVSGHLAERELAAAFAQLLGEGAGSRIVVDHVGEDGLVRHLEWTLRAAISDGGEVTGGVVCIADVTDASQLRAALLSRANTDALTGCLNRAGTLAALDDALATMPPDEGIGLLFIDLDGFKRINDSHGHAVGDAVLEIVADRLRTALRPRDLVGRLGGDEFVVIAPGLSGEDDALSFAVRISGQLHGPALVGEAAVAIRASIGVTWTGTRTASELLAAADGAMYVAKHSFLDGPQLAPDGPAGGR